MGSAGLQGDLEPVAAQPPPRCPQARRAPEVPSLAKTLGWLRNPSRKLLPALQVTLQGTAMGLGGCPCPHQAIPGRPGWQHSCALGVKRLIPNPASLSVLVMSHIPALL